MTPSPQQKYHGGGGVHRISQSLFDENVLENEEAFDLSPADAVSETLEQFRTQGVDLSHLVTNHPDSTGGLRERKERGRFERWLEILDGRVGSDGTVDVDDDEDGDGDGDDAGKKKDEIVEALTGIGAYCSGRVVASTDGSAPAVGGPDGSDADGAATAESSEGDDDGSADDEQAACCSPVSEPAAESSPAEAETAKSASGGGDSPSALAYLTILQRATSIYTLMTLLGVVPLPSSSDSASATGEDIISAEREEVLKATCRCLTSVLTPRPGSNAETRSSQSSIRDTFVAYDRLVGLIHLYADRVAVLGVAGGPDAGNGGSGAATAEEILMCLLRLATASARNCESNKASFVRARVSRDNGGRHESNAGVSAVLKCLNLPDAGTLPSDERAALLAETCRLVAVLCRFDDFRPTGDGDGGPAGMLPAASSAHDHATEFHRAGAVPALRRIAEAALPPPPDEGEAEADGGGTTDAAVRISELAPAVLSATRVLAVNDDIVQSLVAAGTLDVARRALRLGVGGDAKPVVEQIDASAAAPGAAKEDKSARPRAQSMRERRREALTAAALGLVRNLCGNDEIKTTLCLGSADASSTPSALPVVLVAMRRYRSRPQVQEHGLGTLAAMALRKPENALRIVESGGARDVLTAMRSHPDVVPLQRQGALAVRNVVSRLVGRDGGGEDDGNSGAATAGAGAAAASDSVAVDVRETFLDLGAEAVLREIAGKHQGSVDEAYAALRDLGCKVSMIKIDADALNAANANGAPVMSRGTVMFGDVKPKFNPVYEESEELGGGGMEGRVATHAAGC